MVFTNEYKQQCFDVLRHDQNIENIMKSLESNDDIIFRFQLEGILDTLEENLKPRILLDEGDMLMYNSICAQYLKTKEIYTIFMDNLIQELDTQTIKIHLYDTK